MLRHSLIIAEGHFTAHGQSTQGVMDTHIKETSNRGTLNSGNFKVDSGTQARETQLKVARHRVTQLTNEFFLSQCSVPILLLDFFATLATDVL